VQQDQAQKKPILQNTAVLRVLAIAATVLVVVLLACLVVNLVNVGKLSARRRALEAEHAKNELLIERMEQDILHYTDLETIEKTAREELDMIASGETVYEGNED